MINEIFDGISVALERVFGSGYEIYGDQDIRQGLKEPCFFIAVVSSSRTRRAANRFYALHHFDVVYYPGERGNNTEMQSVANTLYETLEIITLLNGDEVRGTEMRHESIDGVLHFFVDYNLFLQRNAEAIPMETVVVDANTQEG